MKWVYLKDVTLLDLTFTILFCGMSFVSDFVEQLCCIFVISFIGRFIFNYILLAREEGGKNDRIRR